jgi:hypothetical protein
MSKEGAIAFSSLMSMLMSSLIYPLLSIDSELHHAVVDATPLDIP